MRIVSTFHDYYDSVHGHLETDYKDCIYLRETKKLDETFPIEYGGTGFFRTKTEKYVPKFTSCGYREVQPAISTFTVLVAGKMYLGLAVDKSLDEPIQFFYTKKSLLSYLEKERLEHLIREGKYINDLKELESVFAFRDDSKLLENYAYLNKIVVAIDFRRLDVDWRKNKQTIILNPLLKTFQFQKVLDPYVAYQEIELWVSNLANNEVKPSPQTDKEKILTHGFDLKTSFRGKEIK